MVQVEVRNPCAAVLLSLLAALAGCDEEQGVRLDLQRQLDEARRRADRAAEAARQMEARREQDRRVLEARERESRADADAAVNLASPGAMPATPVPASYPGAQAVGTRLPLTPFFVLEWS